MNSRLSNSLVLVALALSALAVVGVHFLPERTLVFAPSSDAMKNSHFFLDSTRLDDGGMSAEWIDRLQHKWRCNVPEHFAGNYFNCGMGIDLSRAPNLGTDLSRYSHLTIHLHYTGQNKANRVRLAIRHFDPAYSKVEDSNSSKFNSLQLHTSDLGQPLRLGLDEFTVADWWLGQYNIPLAKARPDLSNALTLTIDFGDRIPPGSHEFQLDRLEFSGEWVSAEHAYLAVLAFWMLGIFGFTLQRMLDLRSQAEQGIQIISRLSTSNAELRMEKDKFRRLSTVDPLTQTFNRFGIDKIVATLMAASQDRFTDTPNFSLIMIDIDHFKRVNDRRGHDAGDRVLQQVSSIIQSNIRPVDFLGRWGGEEFLVIMPNTQLEVAVAMAERIRLAISDTEYEAEQPLTLTASFGVSDQLEAEDFATTFKRADMALYSAKAQGRNCVVIGSQAVSQG